jgi:tetratricopeptide (TPR) repeat protein
MIIRRAEENFQRGLELLRRRKAHEGLSYLKTALDIEGSSLDNDEEADARYHSWYGLGLCLTRSDPRGAIHHCRQASRLGQHRPDVWWNLYQVLMTYNRRGEAYRALQQGLRIDPDHNRMNRHIEAMGIRSQPPLSVVPRNHPANIAIGKFLRKLRETLADRRLFLGRGSGIDHADA